MTNREFFERYSTEKWALEQNLCFLIQSYIEQIEKKTGQSYLAQHYNPVTFVKEFMREETIADVEMAEKSLNDKKPEVIIDVEEIN